MQSCIHECAALRAECRPRAATIDASGPAAKRGIHQEERNQMPDTNTPNTDDAELLALCATFQAATAEADRIEDLSMVYENLYGVHEDAFEEVHERWYATLEALTMLRPRTPAGRLAKLRVARQAMVSLNPEMMDREVFAALIVLDELLADADCIGEMSWLGQQLPSSPRVGWAGRDI